MGDRDSSLSRPLLGGSTAVVDAMNAALDGVARPIGGDSLGWAMRELIARDLASPPFPGSGATLQRWRVLAAVGALDLSLAKLYEGHTDALAILEELGGVAAEGLWAVWAAEPPRARVVFRAGTHGGSVHGVKAWCSGAADVDYAVMSAWTEHGASTLVRVGLRQPGVAVETDTWKAVGMSASRSGTVRFDDARAQVLGEPGDYVARPGFWQGGAGIAAVWFGGAAAVAQRLAASSRVTDDSHAAAHLGAVDTALRGARALLIETAGWIDAHPRADASAAALRVRASVEAAANDVLVRVGRALGPGPLCADAEHAQRCADLTVFLRQSHAEHDLAALGRDVAGDPSSWAL